MLIELLYCVNAYAEDKSKIAVAGIFSNRFCKKIEKVRPHNPIFKPVTKKTKSCIFSGGKRKSKKLNGDAKQYPIRAITEPPKDFVKEYPP